MMCIRIDVCCLYLYFFNGAATPQIYTLSLHDALPISSFAMLGDLNIAEPKALIGFAGPRDRKSTRLNSSHSQISYAVFCLKKKTTAKEIARAERKDWTTCCTLIGAVGP